jgi:hypothetical protein
MTRSDVELLVAVALLQAGGISLAECKAVVDKTLHRPRSRRRFRNGKIPPSHSLCACGNEMRHQFGPCAQCEEEHAALYDRHGRRRILGPTDYD